MTAATASPVLWQWNSSSAWAVRSLRFIPKLTDISLITIPTHLNRPIWLDLIETVKNSDVELGLAFDGDGDRLGVVTKSGQIIYPDRQIMLFAADILKHNPGAPIIYDVKCTRRLVPWIKEHGGRTDHLPYRPLAG